MLPEAGWMRGSVSLFLVLFFLVFVEVVLFVLLFVAFLFLALFLFFFVEIVGNGVQMDGMRLRDFQFGFTLRAAQNFALLHFVFIDINFGATIGAANHGTSSDRKSRRRKERQGSGRHHPSYYIPHDEKSNCS
jgi:hypothetical protein